MKIRINSQKHFSLSSHLLKFGILYLLALLILSASMMSSQFLTVHNTLNVLRQVSPVIILALGEGVVIITSGIELSVGALVALSGMVAAGAVSSFGGRS